MSSLRSKNACFSGLKNPLFDVKQPPQLYIHFTLRDPEMMGFR